MEQETDKTIACNSCSTEFVWSAGEQQSMMRKYKQGIFQTYNAPKKCKACCIKRNAMKQAMEGRNY